MLLFYEAHYGIKLLCVVVGGFVCMALLFLGLAGNHEEKVFQIEQKMVANKKCSKWNKKWSQTKNDPNGAKNYPNGTNIVQGNRKCS